MSHTSHTDQRPLTAPDRLAWRLPEWMKLTGTSRPTLWRQVKRGDLKLVYVGPTPMVPRSEAIRLGLINS
jgi:predicted DNA-binding transcriptional regulator AlpA